MSTVTKKQREIIDRPRQILRVSRDIFRKRGYLGLNMDRIAEQMGIAKGTIYQHFKNKEEVILAMAVETLEKRIAMFERAVLFQGCARSRMAAMGCAAELFVINFPDHFELEKVLSCSSIIEKTSEKLQTAKTVAEMRCISLVAGLVRDGIASGGLSLPNDFKPDQVVFGLWSISYGGYSIMESQETLKQMGIENGFRLVRDMNNKLLDGFGWKPLSSELDYNAIFDEVRTLIFSDFPKP
ncbi:MAG: TetR/AcrR family transcriptional regulator [Planctomycetaceae bacterium]|nr:TetR/AcrR family transcriptional regulator [Planctomycetaceae bacterium]MCP4462852.1 TetR/AcrR family transcriptional regulator [Planctomycetaceae bacterium]MDG1808815.1 TetR/AcrR family transcriptional regulator [Pirellulaceae bacterium]MDG2102871.1 TetR/AcrR family transcriptional regulator [Pirellulaceae bacterium]